MYTRNYYSEGEATLSPPEKYDGTAFTDKTLSENETEEVQKEAIESKTVTTNGILSGLGRFPLLSSLFGDGGGLGNFGHLPIKIGNEEILIIATAAFLFLSKNGDRECALILLLLLFIG